MTAMHAKQKSAAKKARQKQQKQVQCHQTVCLVPWPGSMYHCPNLSRHNSQWLQQICADMS